MSSPPAPSAPATVRTTPLSLFQEFRAFLDKYGVVGLAIAFIIGAAMTQLVQAVVADILMPILTLALPKDSSWQTSVLPGPVPIAWGHFLYTLLYFVIIALFVFLVAKYVLREREVSKR